MSHRGLYDRRRFLWLMFGLRLLQFIGCAVLTGWLIWAWRSGGEFSFVSIPAAVLAICFAWTAVLEWRKPR